MADKLVPDDLTVSNVAKDIAFVVILIVVALMYLFKFLGYTENDVPTVMNLVALAILASWGITIAQDVQSKEAQIKKLKEANNVPSKS
jgi:hypothetical protein